MKGLAHNTCTLASELTAMGMTPGTIQAIKFNVLKLNGAGTTEKLVVKVGGTSVASLSATSWEDFTFYAGRNIARRLQSGTRFQCVYISNVVFLEWC